MLDLLAIVFSGLMMIAVAIRAIHMDATEEWFQRIKRPDNADADVGTEPPKVVRPSGRDRRV